MTATRIEIGKDKYVICGISDIAQEYTDIYSSWDECYEELMQEIIDDCKTRGYNETTIKKVLSHYKIKFANYAGEWIGV